MKFAEYIAYFQNAATSNKAIAHGSDGRKTFRRIDIEEVLTGLKADMNGQICMFLENPEIRTLDALSDNQRKLMTGAFLILQQADKIDIGKQETALDQCLEVSEQVLSKMMNDARKSLQDKTHPWKLKGFDPNTVSMEKVGPVFGYFYGWRVQFTLNQPFPGIKALDESKWFDDTKWNIQDSPLPDMSVVKILNQDGDVLEVLHGGQNYTVTEIKAIIDTITGNQTNITDDILP